MKKIVLSIFLLVTLGGCANNNSELVPFIDKEFVESNAKIGLNKEEVIDILGEEYISGYVDSTDLWLYESVKANYEYEPNLEAVSHEEIKNDDIAYQLFIVFVDEKAFMYSYFYKGDDGRVWGFSLNPDGTTNEVAVSR